MQVSLVITSHSLLPKLRAILTSGKCPRVETVIFMEDPNFSTDTEGFPESVKVFSFQSVVRSVCSCVYPLVLQKVASELHPKVRNHGEGPY